ncbi:MAG: hypothetical protein AB7U46_06650 [Paenirhodobacter sp.]|uniref:hypothetical protein n=1 Tax=Paenirhodobacter sp. TaxID=1965326 RepID=UPI003D0C9E42
MRIAFFSLLAAAALGIPLPAARAESPAPPAPEASGQPSAEVETPAFRLIMVERVGCVYCARWNAEIAPKYPLTPEGKAAPLTRVDIHDDWATGLETGPAPVFTPTFVLLQGKREVGRIEGYPGEDFFWGLLDQALTGAGAELIVN